LASPGSLDEGERRQIVDDMLVQIHELSSLVTDLGELTRGEQSDEEVVNLRLDELVEDAVEIARTYARTKSITIEVRATPTEVAVRQNRMIRAVNNLLNNAIKFTPEGGDVLVTCTAGTIRVDDSGPGVPDDEKPRIFDRFWRSPSARSLPGSGLGLAIVAQVVHEAGGTIAVEDSAACGGASFIITLAESSRKDG
jgi:two-component system sensor histidine kinase MprB